MKTRKLFYYECVVATLAGSKRAGIDIGHVEGDCNVLFLDLSGGNKGFAL